MINVEITAKSKRTVSLELLLTYELSISQNHSKSNGDVLITKKVSQDEASKSPPPPSTSSTDTTAFVPNCIYNSVYSIDIPIQAFTRNIV